METAMRNRIVLGLILTGLLMTLVSCAPQQQAARPEGPANLIVNGSFELGTGKNPDGWQPDTWNGQGLFAWVPEGRGGGKCVRIVSTAGGDISWKQTVTVRPSTEYRLSAWIRTENVVPGTAKGALLNIHDIQPTQTPAVTGTKDWTKVECTFNTGGNDSIQVNCLFGGWGFATGTAWYDDVRLEEIGPVAIVSRTVDAAVTIDATKAGEPISPYIYGQFIEHLGKCIYGGIWAEMLEDRKFYYPAPAEGEIWRTTGEGARVLAASPWKPLGPKANIAMSKDKPFVGVHSVQIQLAGPGVPGGIHQDGLWLVKGKDYAGRVILAGDAEAGPVQVNLVWGNSPSQKASFRVEKLTNEFATYPFRLRSSGTTKEGRLEILSQGKGILRVGTVSLMPADNVRGFRKDTLELLKDLNSPIYRWPGGNFVSGYNWKDGIGDPDKRPPRKNPAWTGIEHNDVGIHEFMEFCALIKTEPYVTVNTGQGSVELAAEQVEYCNGSAETPMGKLRAANGRAEPWGIKFWAVGNEMYGNWQLGNMPLSEYVKKHNAVVAAMRKVDPTIKPVAVGAVGEWSRTMMAQCADAMSAVSEHFYCQSKGDIPAHVAQIVDNIRRIGAAHRDYRAKLESLKGKDIRIAMDEWNYWYGRHVFGEIGTRYFVKDGLGIAAGLHEYFRNSDIYLMANYAQTVNVIGCIKTSPAHAAMETTGLALQLYRQRYGVIPLEVANTNTPLDVAAAWSADRKTITVGVVNPTFDTIRLSLDLSGVKADAKARVWRIDGNGPFDYNDPEETPKVTIREGKVAVDGPVEIKPLSIQVIEIKVR
jgi:alpha-L-arabinofuranosidase